MTSPASAADRAGVARASISGAATLVALVGVGSLLVGSGAAAQTPTTPAALAAACVDAGGVPAVCSAGAVAARGVMGVVGSLSGAGGEVPATATTLGTRVQGGPRLTFYGRAMAADVGLPDLTDGAGVAERKLGATALHAGMAAGLFDGFRLMPTVGGFLSFDVFGHAAFLFLPASEQFAGSSTALTAGVRVGLLREGFTVPGVSLSVSRRFVGAVEYGTPGDEMLVRVDPSVTSYRALVGKDLFAVELSGGVGWDDVSGDASLVRIPDGPGAQFEVAGALDGRRRVYFGSAAMTFGIVFTLSVEGGWVGGFDRVSGYAGSHDPTAGGPYGSFSARLTL